MQTRRVVITGLGAITPVGHGAKASWQAVKAGQNGFDYIAQYDRSLTKTQIAAEVKDFDAAQFLDKKEVRRTDRAQQFAIYATHDALADSGLQITEENAYDVGCVVGTGIGGIITLEEMSHKLWQRGARAVGPLTIPNSIPDSISGRLSIEFGMRGVNYSLTSACATGNNSIADAADYIRLGRAEAMIAGGSEAAIVPLVVAGFENMKAMTTWDADYHGEPALACRPFDLNRTGFVMAEGAAVVVLESLDHAQARGAHIYAEVTGYGHTSDAYHITAPREDGTSAAESMRRALRDAGLAATDIDYINAHGTGTLLNDKSETLAMKLALGEHAYTIPVSSTKSSTGHMLGAAGAIEAIFSVLAMQDHYVPPTLNLETPDPECDLDYVPHVGRDHTMRHVMSYSAGFGGHNSTLILSRFEG